MVVRLTEIALRRVPGAGSGSSRMWSVPWSWSGMVSPGAAECGADQCVGFVVVAGVAGAGGDGAASDCAVLNAAIRIAW